ncbi:MULTISPECIES: hypothetical protein [unclassified Gilliamella]|uniref:hypothetical protein n=1 Tax=unclassified Gilliamella TaxID=2685620 RepID=UPI00226A2E14|nr:MULTISPECIES: hypothetical protein [unclassified Gilliamella]MCX8726351.1 hypothetical protein [Gilliamella sp. B2838]MCX8738289.1 hypothetical protein [Gilliamella sp. B2824]
MNINDKVLLQQEFKGILLFKEGMFFRTYNQGVYILTEHLGHNLQTHIKQIKKYHNKQVIICGFPVNTINERLPNAKLFDFGVKLAFNYSIDEYSHWYERRCPEKSEAR